MRNIIEIKQQTPILFIYWLLTDYCNFSCRYCPPNLHSGYIENSSKKISNQQIIKFVDDIIDTHLDNQQLKVSLSGGECTTHEMFPYILDKLTDYGEITVVTNGSRPVNWWSNLPKLPAMVVISLHPQFTNIEKINTLSRFLSNSGVDLSFNLMCDPEKWDDVVVLYNALDDIFKSSVVPFYLKHIEFDPNDLQYGNLYEGYTDKHHQFIKKVTDAHKPVTQARGIAVWEEDNNQSTERFNITNLIKSKRNSFFGWKCNAGKDGIFITPDGVVWGGICKIIELGTIDNFRLLKNPINCTRIFCPCPGDIVLPKIKSNFSQ